MNCEYFKNNLDAFIDCELDDDTHMQFKEHVEQCPSCGEFYTNYNNMILGLNDLGTVEFVVSDELHNKIMSSVKNVDKKYIPKKSSISTNSTKYTLVAGLVTLFIASGSYQTYQFLEKNPVIEQPFITVDIDPNLDITEDNTISVDTQKIEPDVENVNQNLSAIDDAITEKNTNQNITIQPIDNPVADQSVQAYSEPTVTASTTNSSKDSHSAESKLRSMPEPVIEDINIDNVEPPQATPFMLQSNNFADVEIVLDNPADIDDCLNYISNFMDLRILNIEPLDNEYLVRANTSDLNTFMEFVNNYQYNNTSNNVTISLLNDLVESNTDFTFILK